MTDGPSTWTRRQVQGLLVLVVAVALLLGLGIWAAVSGGVSREEVDPRASTPPARRSLSAQDRIATEPMPVAPAELARPGRLSTDRAASVTLPVGTALGPADVPTGFPQTVEGAVAQLAAIDAATLSSGSVRVAQEIIDHWAAPGGPSATTWSGVRAVAAFISSAGIAPDDDQVRISTQPAMALVKGDVGGDEPTFVVPCLQLVVTLQVQGVSESRTSVGDCQRMVWVGDRWLIGPGQEPAAAPSLWPGTEAAYTAGFSWIEYAS